VKKLPAYVIISMLFFLLIAIGFAYCYFFYPAAHPVGCVIRDITGKDCPSCGFSRAFSYYTHLQFEEGRGFNARSLPVFIFFAVQLAWRGGLTAFFLFTRRQQVSARLEWTDAALSAVFFLWAFLPLLFGS
jgi:hypothetical protein